ncbi:hypothetical protein HS125_16625 [bacterium]|nr:hypothetical protein [bacterium]
MPARAEKAVSAGEPPLSAAAVRADFRSTIFWSPMIETDSAGMARVPLKYAESLTQWRATARAFTADTRVGEVFVKTRTRKNVMIRLQAPRFFVERDLVTLSANVHNEFAEPLRVKVSITVAAATDNEEAPLQLSGESVRWVEVGPRAQQRVDWTARATRPAPVNITVTAESGRESDAMMRTYPVMVHGAPKMLTAAGSFKNKWTFSFKLPEERSPEVSRLKIIVTPSLAASLFDCLSYLADYPYGCVEQTMSRFLPSAIVARTLERQGLSRDDVDPQLSEKLRDGLARLAGFQHNDGGWGWWTADDSNPWMSTYVCFGLQLLGDADYNIDRNMLDRGLNYLRNELLKQGDNPDMAAFMLYVLGKAGRSDAEMDKLSAALYERREKLSPSTLALLGLYYHSKKDLEKSGVIGRNLVGFAKVEKSNDTAQFGRTGVVVRWSEAAVEATALSLYALAEIAPEEPVVRQAVRWLVYNRRGNRWNSTRDTALAVLALNAYLEKSGEQKSAGTLTLSRAGRVMDTWRIEAETRVRPRELTLAEGEWLAAGNNRYELAWDGGGEVYAFAYLTFFTKEEDITAAGNEVFVSRKYYRVVPKETLLQGVYETKVELEPGESVRSGERLEVELSIDCKNNYEYLVFEDYKPAGCEPIAQVSGPAWGAVYTQMELRDEKVAFFVSRMNQGRHEIRYQLRAEVPGAFHVLPHQAHAMYVPEIRANSAEGRLEIAP